MNGENNKIKYFKLLFSNYSLIKIISYSIILISIILLLDIFNVPTFIIEKVGYIFVALIICFVLLKFVDYKLFDLFKLKAVNYLDFWSLVFSISVLIYYIIISNSNDFVSNAFYQHEISAVISIIMFLALLYRILYINIFNKKVNEESNVFDLKDLYEGNIINNGKPVYLEEKEVDYDLLQRARIINQLKNTIEHCYVNDKFVISLKGPWGSGKTTIIKNVKRKLYDNKNLIFIDDFNPWSFDNSTSLLRGMFDSIMNKIGYNFSITEINKIFRTYLNIISENTKFKIDKLNYDNSNSELLRIKQTINSYLIANNKRIVFVIDNIERTSNENILFIINLISNLFDFKRIIYVISYDESVMKEKFKNIQVKYEYLEKIIQMEITVPALNIYEINNVINTSFKNLLKIYNEDVHNSEDLDNSLKILSSHINNIRDLKRIINSTFTLSFHKDNYLNKIDTLLIEIINLKNHDLYEEIYLNKEFYISEDYYIYSDKYMFNTEQYNKEATSYFGNLFQNSKYKYYEALLSYLFPNIKEYFRSKTNLGYGKDRIEFRSEQSYISDIKQKNYEECVRTKRIFNGKFFDLYFTKDNNEFIVIDQKVAEFIEIVNNGDLVKIAEGYNNLLLLYTNFVQKYILETLEYYLDSIKENEFALLCTMYETVNFTDNSSLFFQLNASERNLIIIADLINRISDEELNVFINKIRHDYKNLKHIKSIRYWLEPDRRIKKTYSQERFEKFNKMFEELKEEIIKKKINLYDFNYYNRYNFIFFDDNETYIKFIKRKINSSNILLFLADMISMSNGTNGYGYELDKTKMQKILSIKKAEGLLRATEDESGLKDIILKAFYPPEDVWKENTYYTKDYVDLNRLTTLYVIDKIF